MNDLRSKLKEVIRELNVYDSSNQIVEEIPVTISIEKLSEIISPTDNDPEFFDGYELNENQLKLLIPYLNKPYYPDYEKNSFVLVASGIYNW